MNEGDR